MTYDQQIMHKFRKSGKIYSLLGRALDLVYSLYDITAELEAPNGNLITCALLSGWVLSFTPIMGISLLIIYKMKKKQTRKFLIF